MKKYYIVIIILFSGLLLLTGFVGGAQPHQAAPLTNNFSNFSNTTSNTSLYYVFIVSSFPSQNQYLTVLPGQTNVLMYPYWHVHIFSSTNSSYVIYENNISLLRGFVFGAQVVNLNFSTSSGFITLSVVLNGKLNFTFANEHVAEIPLYKFYGPTQPPFQFTAPEVQSMLAKFFVGTIFGIIVTMLTVRKWVIEREKREVFIT